MTQTQHTPGADINAHHKALRLWADHEVNRLKAVNAQLLEALEELVEEAREDNQDAGLMHAFISARAAIKATKED